MAFKVTFLYPDCGRFRRESLVVDAVKARGIDLWSEQETCGGVILWISDTPPGASGVLIRDTSKSGESE